MFCAFVYAIAHNILDMLYRLVVSTVVSLLPTLTICLISMDGPITRGDYDYCGLPETLQLSSLEVGEDNSKFEPEIGKFKSINMVKQKGCYRGF